MEQPDHREGGAHVGRRLVFEATHVHHAILVPDQAVVAAQFDQKDEGELFHP